MLDVGKLSEILHVFSDSDVALEALENERKVPTGTQTMFAVSFYDHLGALHSVFVVPEPWQNTRYSLFPDNAMGETGEIIYRSRLVVFQDMQANVSRTVPVLSQVLSVTKGVAFSGNKLFIPSRRGTVRNRELADNNVSLSRNLRQGDTSYRRSEALSRMLVCDGWDDFVLRNSQFYTTATLRGPEDGFQVCEVFVWQGILDLFFPTRFDAQFSHEERVYAMRETMRQVAEISEKREQVSLSHVVADCDTCRSEEHTSELQSH